MAQNTRAVGFPTSPAPIVDENGRVSKVWLRTFASMAQGPQAAQAVTLGASPYSFAAPVNGSLVVSAGTVSLIQLTRGRVTVDLGVIAGHFPASTGDVFKITYTVAPTVTFLPG